MKKNLVLILAGGSGSRIDDDLPKQFLTLKGKTILQHTIEKFENHPAIDHIFLVTNSEFHDKTGKIIQDSGYGNKEENFHPFPDISIKKATIIFREKVFNMLKDNNRISDLLISKMRQWTHPGFSVYNKVVVEENHSDELEKMAQYIVHPTFFADKIRYKEDTGSVIYKSRMHLGKKRNIETFKLRN